jgi:hypothetical protein
VTLEARKLCQVLLDWHQAKTVAHPVGKKVLLKLYTIPYGDLCNAAGVPHVLMVVGKFLQEIAEWCEAEGFPPLNSLAVNSRTGIPGDGYDGAGNFYIVDWPRDAEACVRFADYPATAPP